MENNTQIPIYRARKINTDEFVIGDLFSGKFIITTSILNEKILSAIKHIEEDVLSCSINEDCKNEHMELKNMLTKLVYNERLEHIYEIDPSTLSIHFPSMLDSQGNKIFASLSKDGRGGDLVEVYEKERILANYTAKWSRCGTNVLCFDVGTRTTKKILGIQL